MSDSDLNPKCLVCKNPMPIVGTDEKSLLICIDCAKHKEFNLKEELATSLSEKQMKVFQDLIDIMNYKASWIIFAS